MGLYARSQNLQTHQNHNRNKHDKHSLIHTRTLNKMCVWYARMIPKIKYAYHTRIIRSTVNAITYSLVPTATVHDVTSVSALSVLNVISTAKAAFCPSAYQYSIHLTKLSCVGFCSSCTFDYLTEYFMLSRNGSARFTFHTYDKITRVSYTCMI